jgi:hypothetical protein
MTCDCCGHYEPTARIETTGHTLYKLSPICAECFWFAIISGLRLAEVADFIQLCHSMDTTRIDS